MEPRRPTTGSTSSPLNDLSCSSPITILLHPVLKSIALSLLYLQIQDKSPVFLGLLGQAKLAAALYIGLFGDRQGMELKLD